jgi:hypothetical protein
VSPVFQLAQNPVEVGAVPIEVHPVSEDSPVVQSREKVGESSKFLKEGFPCSFPNCPKDEVSERHTIAELLHQHTVEAAIVAEGTGDVVRIPGKTDAAQMMQVIEFPLHTMKGSLRRAV